ncbi:MAG TPA: hypothetical protein VN948_23350 [Terriglobales bacterium]|nr:hypothetical protein [Terriglobales bacterium]
MRNNRFPTFSSLLVLAAALAIPALVLAQDNNSQNDAPAVFSYGVARSQTPSMMITVIGFTNASVGMQVTGFPCMGGASGCADQIPGTIALSAPMAVVMKGSKVTYTFEFEDVSYTGPCSLSFVLMNGTTKLDSGHYKFPSGCKPNTVYFAGFNRILKSNKKMGIGALNGSLKAGTHKDTISQKFCFM